MESEKKKVTQNEVNSWVTQLEPKVGIPVKRISDNEWEVGLSHAAADYSANVHLDPSTVSISASLIPAVKLEEKSLPFVREVLELNSQLKRPGAIGIRGDVYEYKKIHPTKGMTQFDLYSSLADFNETHEAVYRKMLELVDKHDARFVTESQKRLQR